MFFGEDQWVRRRQATLDSEPLDAHIPEVQRRPPAKPLAESAADSRDRHEVMVAAYATGDLSSQQLAAYFEVHFTTVGRIVRSRRGK
ncbi:MAG: hypothetical protein V3S24_04315 [Candidatus Tectomicrobia bacterium]